MNGQDSAEIMGNINLRLFRRASVVNGKDFGLLPFVITNFSIGL